MRWWRRLPWRYLYWVSQKKTHFLNCRFAKPGLRVCGLPLPVKQPTVEGHVGRKSKRSVEAPRQGVIEVKQMKIKFWIWNPQKYKRNPIYVYEVCVCCKKWYVCIWWINMIYIAKKCLSVCLSRFILTFLSGVYSELSAVRGNKTLRKPLNVST